MEKKIIGYNFLETHPVTEKELNLDDEHVIVDRRDWEIVMDYFRTNPQILERIGKNNVPWFG